MKKVEVIDIPVRYKGETYKAGESFEVDEEHLPAIEQYVNVISESKPVEEMKLDELKEYAKAKEIDLGNATKREDILAIILGKTAVVE